MKEQTEKLLPIRHPNGDFFIADIFDNIPLKDDTASMSVPIFSLSKKKDLRTIEYEKNGVKVTVSPAFEHGLPTIFDKDILLYCGSFLMQEINKGIIPPRTIRISSHNLLVATNRETNGKSYKLLDKALARLTGVLVSTNIETNGVHQKDYFHLIDKASYIESSFVKDRRVGLEITLSDWFYNSILGKEVLTINPEYFRLGRAIERRLYEIARKHCGRQKEWVIGLANLKEKVGSTGSLVKFRYYIKQIAEENYLPDYTLAMKEDIITFTNRKSSPQLPLFEDIQAITPETIAKARRIVEQAGTGWDFSALHAEFSEQIASGRFKPDNANGAFIGFVKKKVRDWA